MYLGIDFWRKFQLAPEILGVESLEHVESEFITKSEPVEPHILNPQQQQKLEGVKNEFLTYENTGLGKTYLEQHTIQLTEGAVPVKQ